MNPTNLIRVDLTPGQVAMSLCLAFALAFIWATVYRKTHSGVAYSRSFFLSLMLIAPIVSMIMMAIGSNIALSLGLVGSLSVIRFRNVIKDTKDMTFLFFTIALGLCVGANVWLVAVIGTVLGVSGGAQDLTQLVIDLTFNLPNSRTDEVEADRIGVELAARGGFDPRAAVTLWEKMQKESKSQPPQFLSTHPSHASRINDLRGYAEKVLPLFEAARAKR